MPSVSKKQHNFMAAAANNPGFAKKAGIKPTVAQDFMIADMRTNEKFDTMPKAPKKVRKVSLGGKKYKL